MYAPTMIGRAKNVCRGARQRGYIQKPGYFPHAENINAVFVLS